MTTFCFWKKINNNFASSLISQKIIGGFVIMCILSSFFIGIKFFEKEAQAVSTYDSVGGALVVGNEITRTRTNSGS